MNIQNSTQLFKKAQALLPGGVDSPARAFGAVGGQPVFIDRGEGPYMIDIDGNRYIDYVLSFGPLIRGHAHPDVVARLGDHVFGEEKERLEDVVVRDLVQHPDRFDEVLAEIAMARSLLEG